MNGESAVAVLHTQGLLWRCTENLLEYRTSSLNTGYFARLDYVAFISMEVGLNPENNTSRSGSLSLLLNTNMISNHLLNLACTVADSGALGCILWAFELREVASETIETTTGARMHINSTFTEFTAIDRPNLSVNLVVELLLLVGIGLRVNRGRLAGNFITPMNVATETSLTGYLLFSSGTCDVTDHNTLKPVLGCSTADSLVRHVSRVLSMQSWSCVISS